MKPAMTVISLLSTVESSGAFLATFSTAVFEFISEKKSNDRLSVRSNNDRIDIRTQKCHVPGERLPK